MSVPPALYQEPPIYMHVWLTLPEQAISARSVRIPPGMFQEVVDQLNARRTYIEFFRFEDDAESKKLARVVMRRAAILWVTETANPTPASKFPFMSDAGGGAP
jgi:hypothetical protein